MDRDECKHCCSLLDRQLSTGDMQDGNGRVTVKAGEGPQYLIDQDLELCIVIFDETCALPGLIIIGCKTPYISINLNTIVQK